MEKKGKEKMNGCKICCRCDDPRLKNGKGGKDCRMNSKEDKLFAEAIFDNWNGKQISPLTK